MKLKIEHLAPYLPYGLKVYNTLMEVDFELTIYEDNTEPNTIHLEYLLTDRNEYKPILRPLSDLTKEIEHNGEKFIPIEWFEIGDDEGDNWFEFDHGNIKLINYLNSISIHKTDHDINYLPYAVVQKIIEWHFDVFRLTEKGLAIDINKLEGVK